MAAELRLFPTADNEKLPTRGRSKRKQPRVVALVSQDIDEREIVGKADFEPPREHVDYTGQAIETVMYIAGDLQAELRTAPHGALADGTKQSVFGAGHYAAEGRVMTRLTPMVFREVREQVEAYMRTATDGAKAEAMRERFAVVQAWAEAEGWA